MKFSCLLVVTTLVASTLPINAVAQGPRQILLQTNFVEVNRTNVSELGFDFAQVSEMVNVQSGLGTITVNQVGQISKLPAIAGQVSVGFEFDTGLVPFGFTGGDPGAVAFGVLFFNGFSVDASSSSTLDVQLRVDGTQAGFGSPGFDAMDINGERVGGTLFQYALDPTLYHGRVDFSSNPDFLSSSITAFGVDYNLLLNSDAMVSFDSVQFAGVPEPGMLGMIVFGAVLLATGRRRKSVRIR